VEGLQLQACQHGYKANLNFPGLRVHDAVDQSWLHRRGKYRWDEEVIQNVSVVSEVPFS